MTTESQGTELRTVELNFVFFKRPCDPSFFITCMLWFEAISIWILPGFTSLRLMSTHLLIGLVGLAGGAILWYLAFLAINLAIKKEDMIACGEFKARAAAYMNFRRPGFILFAIVNYWINCAVSFHVGWVAHGFGGALGASMVSLIFTTLYIILALFVSFFNGYSMNQAIDIVTGGDGTGITDQILRKPKIGESGEVGENHDVAVEDEEDDSEFAPQ